MSTWWWQQQGLSSFILLFIYSDMESINIVFQLFNAWSRMRWAECGSIFFSLYLTPLEYKIRQNEVGCKWNYEEFKLIVNP